MSDSNDSDNWLAKEAAIFADHVHHAASTDETEEARLKRMRMRSWRRGTKEMDIILGSYADAHLVGMTPAELQLYDRLLTENDQDLYQWVTSQSSPPEHLDALINTIAVFANIRKAK